MDLWSVEIGETCVAILNILMYLTNIREASTALSQVVFSGDVDAMLERKNKVLMEYVHVSVQRMGWQEIVNRQGTHPQHWLTHLYAESLHIPSEFRYPHG